MVRLLSLIVVCCGLTAPAFALSNEVRPAPRVAELPRAWWEYRPEGDLWSRVALSAVKSHGAALIETVPRDIGDWCPAYESNPAEARAAFWVALLSTVSRYESTWRPRAVGGGGRWFGLMQIAPSTADFRGCRVRSGTGLLNGADNLNCAVRILSVTIPRDGVISEKGGRWQGVAADWGPMRNAGKRRSMQAYTKRQTYCRPLSEVRPARRP